MMTNLRKQQMKDWQDNHERALGYPIHHLGQVHVSNDQVPPGGVTLPGSGSSGSTSGNSGSKPVNIHVSSGGGYRPPSLGKQNLLGPNALGATPNLPNVPAGSTGGSASPVVIVVVLAVVGVGGWYLYHKLHKTAKEDTVATHEAAKDE
jgi:hypothetical protein